ncbi:hypothetical protein KCU92_g5121, partial [Aureobasidium melanogenum]
MPVQELIEWLKVTDPSEIMPLNFLDIHLRLALNYRPELFDEHDTRIAKKYPDKMIEDSEVWFLAAGGHSVSPFHCDKAGYNTWVQVLQGAKSGTIPR